MCIDLNLGESRDRTAFLQGKKSEVKKETKHKIIEKKSIF